MPNSDYKIIENDDLSHCNTMALICFSQQTVYVFSEEQAIASLQHLHKLPNATTKQQLVVLSGGSNVLLPPKLNAIVIKPMMTGFKKIKETQKHVFIEVMAGENWHDWVLQSIKNGWYGLENLALIPGLVGAAPVQNIGAYGVEVCDFFESLTAINLNTLEVKQFNQSDCNFSYRNSFFKQNPNQWLITKVVFKLQKQANINLNYQDIAHIAHDIATAKNLHKPTPQCVAEAIIQIRQKKLPDPKNLANCGSFFTNPIVSESQFKQLQQQYPNMPNYPQANNTYKLAAGWLIDQAGLKGIQKNNIGTHCQQALVVVNHSPYQAEQKDVIEFSDFIRQQVFDKFGITLHREPIRINADGTFA